VIPQYWRWWPRLWPWLYAGAVVSILMAGFANWGYDDPFITYRYANNLRHGLGLVYNPGEHVLSTTTPLFVLLLAGLGLASPDLPHLANLVGAISLAAGGLLLWQLGRLWRAPLASWAGLLLFPFYGLVLVTLGSETPLYIAFGLGTLVLLAAERYELAALTAALATLTRADGALLAALLGLAMAAGLRRPPRRVGPAIRAGIIYLALTLPWFLFATLYYGSPTPVTLMVKQQQASMAGGVQFGAGFLQLAAAAAREWPNLVLAGLALLGLLYAIWRAQPWLWLFAWEALYFAAYTVLGVSHYFWYYAPLMPGLIASAGLGLELLARGLCRWRPQWPLAWLHQAGLLGLVLLLAAQVPGLVHLTGSRDMRLGIYRAAGEWLNQMTPASVTVGTLEVGIIGYYSDRPMVDFAGLIQPAVARQLSPSTTYQDAAAWAIGTYHPNYVVLNPTWFPDLMRGAVATHCTFVHSLAGQDYGYVGQLDIYSCAW
jgi:hypothetical protein